MHRRTKGSINRQVYPKPLRHISALPDYHPSSVANVHQTSGRFQKFSTYLKNGSVRCSDHENFNGITRFCHFQRHKYNPPSLLNTVRSVRKESYIPPLWRLLYGHIRHIDVASLGLAGLPVEETELRHHTAPCRARRIAPLCAWAKKHCVASRFTRNCPGGTVKMTKLVQKPTGCICRNRLS